MSELHEGREPVEKLAESFLARFRRGERPSLSEYTDRHPELAEEIREVFPALVELEQLGAMAVSDAAAPAPPSPPAGLGWQRLGEFRIIREVARGGMGVVYEAVQESLGRHVALKVLPLNGRLTATQIERFRLEARSAARLHHGNIVPVHGVGEHQGVHYYAMQFIQGHGLDAILDDLRQLRGLVEGTAVTCSDSRDRGAEGSGAAPASAAVDRPAPPDPPGSLALARSLLTGRFRMSGTGVGPASRSANVADRERTLAEGGPDATARLHPDEGSIVPIPSLPAPECAGPSPANSSPSELSMAVEAQFYRSVARIGLQVADALAYAHGQGVLHRDIKPSNLMLDVAGHVWVTDFGLAKLEGSDGPTRTGDIVGTLRYMAPERFEGWSDRRSDVYSLGATLYELITLRSLFGAAVQAELIEKVLHDPPEAPRKLDPKIPRDLETIVLKAIAKEPGDRYPTAQALGEDMKRFLEDRPILARRSTPLERFWRWCRRNPGLAAANITAAALTTLLAIVSTVAAWTYRAQRNEIGNHLITIKASEADARRARTEARAELFQALLDRARAGRFSRQVGQRFKSLEALEQAAAIAQELKPPPADVDRLRDEAIACLTLPDLKPTGPVLPRPTSVIGMAFDPAGTRCALRFRDGTVSVRRVADDQEIARFQARGDRDFFIFEFSPDGRYLATEDYPGRALKVWDIDRRKLSVSDPRPIWRQVPFRPDSRRILAASGKLHEYDLATGRLIRVWPGRVDRAVFRPDGAQIAVIDNGTTPPTCQIHEAESGQLVRKFSLRSAADYLAWSPDGRTLAAVGSEIDLWDTVTGNHRAALVGHDNGGVGAAFHSTGTLLASNGWEGRLRFWDAVLGRPLFSLSGSSDVQFSQDGRIRLWLADTLTTYQVEPAREYRTFAHAPREPMDYARPSVRHDGRILAVGSNRGVVVWDLASGTELAFLSIGLAWGAMFEPSGDLLTDGSCGVQRWPVRLDTGRGEFHIGPPRRLPLPVTAGSLAEDRSGRIVAVAAHSYAYVATPERTIRVGPLDDCRYVAVSPDGQWLATGTHVTSHGAQVWRIRDATKVAELPIEEGTGVSFSPDGKWLVTGSPRLRLWEVGTWREEMPIMDIGGYFSPDGRIMVVIDPTRILRLVEFATGRTLARLESPDLCGVAQVAFSPDGTRLVVTTKDRPTPCVHVWDLRAIRKHLAGMGLDWDAPAYAEEDPSDPSAPPLPPLKVDYGPLAGHLEQFTEPPAALQERYSARIQKDPHDADAYHHRAHARINLGRFPEAIADLTQAIRLRPDDAHNRVLRGAIHLDRKQYEPAIADLEAALRLQPDQPSVREWLAQGCNNRAWELANGPAPQRDLERALALSQRAANLAPGEGVSLNTLGVVQYRLGRHAEAIVTLERSLVAGHGQSDGFDLFFLAMAHHRLGHRDQAKGCFDRAVRWLSTQKNLPESQTKELTLFRAEAEAVLARPTAELPDDVFADPPSAPRGSDRPE
ncbi:MAG TPA: protein kinase [Isosphaeraceae bacterium]|nr:protein kinase [Isosphaeraceae bacterium]